MNPLLRTIAIKNHIFHNRLSYPPICIGKAERDGKLSAELLSHYEDLSHGGYFSLIVVPDSFVSQEGRSSLGQLSSASDDMIEGLESLATTIKNNASKSLLQLNHAGSCTFKEITGNTPIGPSKIPNPRKGDLPRALEVFEIEILIEAFKTSALRAEKAGFDGVEIHSAHGNLLNQFFSPLTNQRKDEYGGNLANRIRIHSEIIKAIKCVVNQDFILSIRFGGLDYMENGSTLEDALTATKSFEKEGIDLISISGGMCGYINPFDNNPGYFSQEAKAIKAALNVPLILTGGIKTPKDCKILLDSNACDMLGVGRAVLDDPDWPRLALATIY